MKKIAILSNHHSYTYNLRKEIIQALINEGYKIYIVLPNGEKVKLLEEMGCIFIDVPFNARGLNPFEDLKLLYHYDKILGDIQPDAVLSYTIKPNLYGGLICRKRKIPFFPNVTGLGTAVENDSLIKKAITKLYKTAFSTAETVFFQNENNRTFFVNNNIPMKNFRILPGSGVNLEHFEKLPYPFSEDLNFVYISRVMKDKGINEYLEAAKYIKENYSNVYFHIYGTVNDEYEDVLEEHHEKEIIKYHGLVDDVREVYKDSQATIHPSYHEGMSNVLLESAASSRPVLASDVPGCREIFDEVISGFGFEAKNVGSLIQAIEKFITLTDIEREQMGIAGREKIEREFDRQIVVDIYMEEIKRLFNE